MSDLDLDADDRRDKWRLAATLLAVLLVFAAAVLLWITANARTQEAQRQANVAAATKAEITALASRVNNACASGNILPPDLQALCKQSKQIIDKGPAPAAAGVDGGVGAQGAQGPVGPTGLRGDRGPAGASVKGPKGDKGDVGTGIQGVPGSSIKGDPGLSIKGDTGDVGPSGPAGADGAPGADSTVPGATGPAGPAGPAGANAPTLTGLTCAGSATPLTITITLSDGTTQSAVCTP